MKRTRPFYTWFVRENVALSTCQESEQELIQERDTRAPHLGLAVTFLGRKTYFMFQDGVFVC